jgi:hypothetical protein
MWTFESQEMIWLSSVSVDFTLLKLRNTYNNNEQLCSENTIPRPRTVEADETAPRYLQA